MQDNILSFIKQQNFPSQISGAEDKGKRYSQRALLWTGE